MALALSLVVLAAFIHATWNLLAKRAAPIGPVFLFAYNLIACVAYAPWVIYLVAAGAMNWSLAAVGVMIASGLIHLAYSLALQRGYQKAEFSVVYPVARGTGPLLATLGAIFILGEATGLKSLLGLACVVLGIGLIATRGDTGAFRRPEGMQGVLWGMGTGGLIALYTVVDAYAVKTMGMAPVLLDWATSILRLVLLAPVAIANPAGARRAMTGAWGLALGVGLLSPLSYILVLYALGMGAPLSVVAPLRETSMMIGAVMGMVALREKPGPWGLAGCAVLVIGAALLAAR